MSSHSDAEIPVAYCHGCNREVPTKDVNGTPYYKRHSRTAGDVTYECSDGSVPVPAPSP